MVLCPNALMTMYQSYCDFSATRRVKKIEKNKKKRKGFNHASEISII